MKKTCSQRDMGNFIVQRNKHREAVTQSSLGRKRVMDGVDVICVRSASDVS